MEKTLYYYTVFMTDENDINSDMMYTEEEPEGFFETVKKHIDILLTNPDASFPLLKDGEQILIPVKDIQEITIALSPLQPRPKEIVPEVEVME